VHHTIYFLRGEYENFRKLFLAFRKVSSGKKIIKEFDESWSFDESSSFCWKINEFFTGLYRIFMIHQVLDESSSFDESSILQHSNIVSS
jgi:hypothetical protein